MGPLYGHTSHVTCLAYSSDGERLVSGSLDSTLRICCMRSGKLIGEALRGHSSVVTSVAFSRNDSRIVSGSYDGTIRVWEGKNGQRLVAIPEAHTKGEMSVAFSPDPDGKQIVHGYISSVIFTPNGQKIISVSDISSIQIWDAKTGNLLHNSFGSGRGTVISLSPDGQTIALGSVHGTIHLWNTEDGKCIAGPFHGHKSSVSWVALSSDGRRIVSCVADGPLGDEEPPTGTIRVWNVQNELPPENVDSHTGSITSIVWSSTGEKIFSESFDETIRTWDTDTGFTIASPIQGHTGHVTAVALSPNDRWLVSGAYDCTVKVWDLENNGKPTFTFTGHGRDQIHTVAVTPDSQNVLSGSDGAICIWNICTGQDIRSPLHVDGTALIRNWKTGDLEAGPFQDPEQCISSVAFSRDGNFIAAGGAIWDLNSQNLISKPRLHYSKEFQIKLVAFSYDGDMLVTGSNDLKIRICNVSTGEVVMGPLEGHDKEVTPVVFSPDGKKFASASADRTIKIWNPSRETEYIAFSPNVEHAIDLKQFSSSLGNSFSFEAIMFNSQTGWIVGPEDKLIFWVPPSVGPGEEQSANTAQYKQTQSIAKGQEVDLSGGKIPVEDGTKLALESLKRTLEDGEPEPKRKKQKAKTTPEGSARPQPTMVEGDNDDEKTELVVEKKAGESPRQKWQHVGSRWDKNQSDTEDDDASEALVVKGPQGTTFGGDMSLWLLDFAR
ncbi:hypothetical protein M422DRAFT_261579 [Sphaerobolus stellatus SS14]|uniref:WD40 repeat-like protein n=1 Tax=Sphaerobolus stellatus (strain SS14) TaxID=990650 RepID=A0A0C9VEJ8_SPHS4|nr:hypothetical protein M422DRAFT_261579 [Sphaerobolus stellatus SS14]